MDDILDGTQADDVQVTGAGAGKSPAAPDWTASLPASLRGVAAQARDMAGLEAALKRGLTHIPVTKPEDLDIPLPEGVNAAEVSDAWFRELAVQQGLSKGQAKALTEAYNRELTAIPERLRAVAEKSLRAEYGEDYEAKIARANDTVLRFDRMSGGTEENPGPFVRMLRMGLGNHPDFIRVMVAVSESVSDSALPGVSLGGGGADAMTTEQFLNEVMSGNSAK
jgi:hypothetical protein